MASTTITLRANSVVSPAHIKTVRDAVMKVTDTFDQIDVQIIEPKLTARIRQDTDPSDPRDNDNIGIMHCAHGRYTLGDKDAPPPWIDINVRPWVVRKDVAFNLPIYMYDHSGLAFSHTPFDCKWDSGLLGWHYITKKAADEAWGKGKWTREQLQKCLECELEEYASYVSGDAWGYVIENEDGEEVDSCWRFLGEDALEHMIDQAGTEHRDLLKAAWEKRFE